MMELASIASVVKLIFAKRIFISDLILIFSCQVTVLSAFWQRGYPVVRRYLATVRLAML